MQPKINEIWKIKINNIEFIARIIGENNSKLRYCFLLTREIHLLLQSSLEFDDYIINEEKRLKYNIDTKYLDQYLYAFDLNMDYLIEKYCSLCYN